jgi:hypothetical protein
MSHSITMLRTDGGARADEILEELAERLDVMHTWHGGTGRAQIWLQFDPDHAYDAVVTALDETAADWRDHLTAIGPRDQSAEAAGQGGRPAKKVRSPSRL